MSRLLKSGLFRKYFLITISIILASFILIGGALTIIVPSIWIDEKLKLLEENTISVKENVEDVLASGYLIRTGRSSIAMICNNLTQISNALDADIFVVNEIGTVVYCKDILQSDSPIYNGKCTFHEQYRIPESIMELLKNGKNYHASGTMDGVLDKSNLIIGSPIIVNNEFRGAVISTQTISTGLSLFIFTIFRMFFISSLLAFFFSFLLVYFVTYRLTKPLYEMSEAAKQYSSGNFTKRIKVKKSGNLFRNTDEIAELANSFNTMAASLTAIEASRKSFVSNVSHELKTPMTTIGGFIDGILDGTIERENADKYLKIVSDEVKRLSRLVTGMLNMSKIEAGQLDIKPTEFDISDMIFRTLLSFEQIIENKNIEIRGLENIAENKVFADKDMINQVIYNLVDNAVKFTPEGGFIEVTSKSDPEKAIIKIKNSGKGIDETEADKIFDRFYKIDKSRSFDVKGAGMGLYIVKTIIELHTGSINVKSIPDEYTEFIFDLPIK